VARRAGPIAAARERRGVYVGLGANLGPDPAAAILAALDCLDREPCIRVLRRSRLYRAPPWGPVPQPDFVNAVAEIATTLATPDVVGRLLAVERRLGRRREGPRFGPRTIDLDLLLDGGRVVAEPGVAVPHPRLSERAFVLKPLTEIDPDVQVPGHGLASALLSGLGDAADAVRPIETDTPPATAWRALIR
jgi:2-amino-4-hydroxy-6-hydroxymethyldihydropteridine diphosphokinase